MLIFIFVASYYLKEILNSNLKEVRRVILSKKERNRVLKNQDSEIVPIFGVFWSPTFACKALYRLFSFQHYLFLNHSLSSLTTGMKLG